MFVSIFRGLRQSLCGKDKDEDREPMCGAAASRGSAAPSHGGPSPTKEAVAAAVGAAGLWALVALTADPCASADGVSVLSPTGSGSRGLNLNAAGAGSSGSTGGDTEDPAADSDDAVKPSPESACRDDEFILTRAALVGVGVVGLSAVPKRRGAGDGDETTTTGCSCRGGNCRAKLGA